MADVLEIIISAMDQASSVFGDIIGSAQEMANSVSESTSSAGSEFDNIADNVDGFQSAIDNIDNSELEALADTLGMDTEEVERLIASGADLGSLSAGFNEASVAADELEKEIIEDTEAMAELGSAGDVMAAQTFMDMANSMKDAMLGAADSAGTFNDSINRASIEAEGAGVSVEEMKNVVSDLSDTTGRAGGQIRESFIKATARGVTDMDSFRKMMEGAGAQAYLLGTDVQTMGDKFSGMAQKDTLMARTLAETGVTMNELADAMGMTGATADEVKDKWKELDTNQRAAVLGTAASMNEGKNANDEYKNSWEGLQNNLEIAKGRLERIAGSVLLPVLIPAIKLAETVLDGFGDTVDFLMKSPLGGLISILGVAGGAFIIAMSGAMALKNILGFLKIESSLAAIETTALAIAEDVQAGSSYASAIANAAGATGFGGLTTAAWGAATAVWAAIAPLLPFIAAAALVVVAIFEVGKAFGWWTDVSSMIDAIQSGLGRLWSAFINHPDVQAVINAVSGAWEWLNKVIGEAWQAVMDFFGVSTGGDFDVVRALIDGIGRAWELIKTPIVAVINFVQTLINVFSSLGSGQIDLYTAVMAIWNNLLINFGPIVQAIANFVLQLAGQLLSYAVQAGLNLFNGIINNIRRLPARVFSILLNTRTRINVQFNNWINLARNRIRTFFNAIINGIKNLPVRVYNILTEVLSKIRSAIRQWASTAKSKAKEVVKSVGDGLSGMANKVKSAFKGVVNAFTKPFSDAWDKIEPYVDKIKSAVSIIPGMGGEAMGGEEDYFDTKISTTTYTITEDKQEINVNEEIKLILDFQNVPSHIDTNTLIKALNDNNVITSLVNNPVFQKLDYDVKEKLLKNINRYNGSAY